MRTLILSDLHLGHHGSRFNAFSERVRRLADCYDRVIVNGDALDQFCGCRNEEEVPLQLERLGKLLHGRKAPPIFLTGNHDPLVSEQHFFYEEEAQLLAFHGDFIYGCAAPWNDLERTFLELYELEIGTQQREHFETHTRLYRDLQRKTFKRRPAMAERKDRSLLGYLISHASLPKLCRIIHYLQKAPERVNRLVHKFPQSCRHAVFGHTHRPGCWNFKERTIYNTGSFMPLSKPFAVVCDAEQVRWMPLHELLQELPKTIVLDPSVAL